MSSSAENVKFWMEATEHMESEITQGKSTLSPDTTFYNGNVDGAVKQGYVDNINFINEVLENDGVDAAQKIIKEMREAIDFLLGTDIV